MLLVKLIFFYERVAWIIAVDHGCQMVYFQTKNTILGIHILEDLGIENAVIYSGNIE
jgi:hypothetical protein